MNNKTTIEGKITTTGKGIGYVTDPENIDAEDVSIEAGNLGTALNGDIVRINVLATKVNDRMAGEVVAVLERAREQFVGTVTFEEDACFINPDNHKLYTNFILDKEGAAQVEENQKVLIRFEEWTKDEPNPKASLVKIFGQKGVHEVEIQSIIFEKGFDSEFPKQVEAEAEEIKKKWLTIPEDEIAKRRDLREEHVMTIDPFDAKDFDDAIHIKKLDNGNFEIGVHIADVAFFVTPGTEIDKEATERATSVYMVDRTIPMLPEVLSNDLCSLNPNEDKMAFSAVFEMNTNAEVINRWFGRSVINSKKRFTYEEAQAVLDAEDGPYVDELLQLNTFAKTMRARNKEAGAIEFEREEIKFELDTEGRPIRIVKKAPLETHKLVENMMLLANREVAKYIHDKGKSFGGDQETLMYRVHGIPVEEKVATLKEFLKALGYNLKLNDEGEMSAQSLNKLFEEVEGKPEESLVKSASVKTMSKAIYATENSGHFGLAFQYYTHFTSPIRRYPDLLVHRILAHFLADEKLTSSELTRNEKSTATSTEQEIAAAEAERESIKYKQAEYMQDHIGKEFDGVISGVTPWGLYVQLTKTLSEGMVHISKLGNDFFNLDEKKYQIVGEKTGKKFTLSDKIRVKIESIDLERHNINMDLVKE